MDALQKKLLPWFKAQCGYFSVQESASNVYKVLLLPRNSYFEAYKTYPLSVGRDIQKIATVEGRQISPYNKDSQSTILHFILKQSDRYLVYYFVLQPRFQSKLDNLNPWFIIPESLMLVLRANRGANESSQFDSLCSQDENGVWLSQLDLNSPNFAIESEVLEVLKPQWIGQTLLQLHNPQIIKQASAKFQRWQQLKFIFTSFSIAAIYFLLVSGYQQGADYFLNEKRSESAPIVSEIFKVKSQSEQLKAQQQEYLSAYDVVSDNVSALIFIESIQNKHELKVDRFRFFGNRAVLEGDAKSANALLTDISNHELASRASLQGDIRRSGSGGRYEAFTIEFYWEDKLWQ